ncbi:class I SAM-dependent methyltransferase [Streptomyces sp. NPDC054794]
MPTLSARRRRWHGETTEGSGRIRRCGLLRSGVHRAPTTSPSSSAKRSERAIRSWRSPAEPGRITLPIARAGVDVTGLDITPSMLARARQRAEDERISEPPSGS